MKINVKRIPAEGQTLHGAEPGNIMELDDSEVGFPHEIAYHLQLQIQDTALLAVGTLDTAAGLVCSRCLKEFELPLHVGQFVVHQELHGEDFVDLTPNIREDILLELPQRALCGPKCKGLCPTCGKNLNEGACQCEPSRADLRWHALDQLRLK